MNRLAVFDCDGTLVDSEAAIRLAMDGAFAAMGLTPPGAATREIMGLSLPEAMAVLHPAGDAAAHHAIGEAYRAIFVDLRAQGRADHLLYEGIVEVIEHLEADGWLLGVATGKSDRGLRLILEHHGLQTRFVTLQTADRHPSKPHPAMLEQAIAEAGAAPATTVMIGDTTYDMAMAGAAGCAAIGVSWGSHDRDRLIAAGALAVAEHPTALIPILATLP